MTTFVRRAATTVATLALAASGALVATAPAYAATTPTFTGISVSGLKSSYTLSSKAKEYAFTVSVSGTAADKSVITDDNGDGLMVLYKPYDSQFYGPKVKTVSSKIKDASAPRISSYPNNVVTGANRYKLRISALTSPGVYEIAIPVTQQNWTTFPSTKVTKIVKKRVTVKAHPKLSLAATRYYAPSWRVGSTAKISFTAPAYQRGGKVTLYYKKKGAKKYTKVVSKTLVLKKGAYSSSAVLKTKKLTKSGRVYFKVSSVKYAKGYKTKTTSITVRRR
ncbi:hypothetical protein ACTVCO_10250 [Sanguibacter sp. A247]|uniref:hypothetical protein n=1 Tax=unclassified Sanguibacter TaxID=2645534 RepID=UPI003FD83122